MASPQIYTVEYDLSARVPSYQGETGLVIGTFEKGLVGERMFISRQDQADLRLGKPGPASCDAYYILSNFLTKSQNCWVMRVANEATYGGALIGSSFPVAIGTADNITTVFSGKLTFGRCLPNTVSIYVDEGKVGYDLQTSPTSQTGSIIGGDPFYIISNDVGAVNTVNYITGEVTVTFATAPPKGVTIWAVWGLPNLSFQDELLYNDITKSIYLDPTGYNWSGRPLSITLNTKSEVEFQGTLPGTINPLPPIDQPIILTVDGTVYAYAGNNGAFVDAPDIIFVDPLEPSMFNNVNGEFIFYALPDVFIKGQGTVAVNYYTINSKILDTPSAHNPYTGTLGTAVLAPTYGTQANATTFLYDGTTLLAWIDFAGNFQDLTGTVIDTSYGTANTFNFNDGTYTFHVLSSYTVVTSLNFRYYVSNSYTPTMNQSEYRTFQDFLVPAPLVTPLPHPINPSTGLEDQTKQGVDTTNGNGATVKIYDGTKLIAWADGNGYIVEANWNDPVTGALIHDTAGSYLAQPGRVMYDSPTNPNIEFVLVSSYTPTNNLTVKYISEAADYAVVYSDSQGLWANSVAFDIKNIDCINNIFDLDVYQQVDLGNNNYTIQGTSDNWTISNVTKNDGYGQALFMEDKINGLSYYIRVLANTLPELQTMACASASLEHASCVYDQSSLIFLSGGGNGLAVNVGSFINALNTFSNKEDINVSLIMDTLGSVPYQVAIAQFSDRPLYRGRGDCYGIYHFPLHIEESTNYINNLINYRLYQLNINTSFAGLYAGWLKIYDTYNGRERWVPPTGYIAGAFSYTCDQFYPWYPAAGWTRGSLPVLDVYTHYTLGERNVLYDNNINAIRYKPGTGIVIWGQKTLYAIPSALDRANVRWLLIVIEKGIEAFLEAYEFELNDVSTRNLVRVGIRNYMTQIQNQNGVYAFNVVCDLTNNSPEDIDNYIMNVDTYVQPTKAVEYIYNRIVITQTGIDFKTVQLSG